MEIVLWKNRRAWDFLKWDYKEKKKTIGQKEYPNSTNEAISGLGGKYTSEITTPNCYSKDNRQSATLSLLLWNFWG